MQKIEIRNERLTVEGRYSYLRPPVREKANFKKRDQTPEIEPAGAGRPREAPVRGDWICHAAFPGSFCLHPRPDSGPPSFPDPQIIYLMSTRFQEQNKLLRLGKDIR